MYDLELVIVIHALNMWRHYLLGKKFTLVTDHINIKYVFNQLDINAQKVRWMAFPSEFEFDIRHIKGKENKIAYVLNRHAYTLMEVSVSIVSIDLIEKIKKSIKSDPKYVEIKQKLQ